MMESSESLSPCPHLTDPSSVSPPPCDEKEDEPKEPSATTTSTTTESSPSAPYSLLMSSSSSSAPPFCANLHVNYIVQLASALDAPTSMEGAWTSHLRMSGVYWSLTALSLLKTADQVDALMKFTTDIVDWVFTCYHNNNNIGGDDGDGGGFGGNTHQDAHLLYTLSALQILALCDRLDDPRLNREQTVKFIASLQQPDGSFVGDHSSSIREIDTRFSYCAVSALSLLGRLDAIDVSRAAEYIALHCRNQYLDGGFGCTMGAESHAGQVFCCVGALSICQRLDLLLLESSSSTTSGDDDAYKLLSWWLSERQVDSGGLNGRPEKQSDVCYSWWILSSLSILGKVSWINGDKLATFILQCQDEEDGGIADRPDDMPDVFHTFFGIAGLSLLGHLHHQPQNPPCRQIDPVYALPTDVVRRLGLQAQVIVAEGEAVDERLSQYSIVNHKF